MLMQWLRYGLILGIIGGFQLWSAPSSAQMPMTGKKRFERYKLLVQIKCLKKCEKVGYRRFYRCGPKGNRYQKARAGVYFRSCISRCRATWFCRGYRTTVQPRCPKMCLRQRQKTMPRKTWRYSPTKKQYRSWVRRFLRWQTRIRYACFRICKNYNMICNIQKTVKMPARTKLPKLKSLR